MSSSSLSLWLVLLVVAGLGRASEYSGPPVSYRPPPAYGYGYLPPTVTPVYPYPFPTYHPTGTYRAYSPGTCLLKLPAEYKGPYTGKCITVWDVNEGLQHALKVRGLNIYGKTGPEVVGAIGDVLWETSVWLADKWKIPHHLAAKLWPYIDVSKTDVWKICPNYYKPNYLKCVLSKYSRLSGDCNDVHYTEKASSGRLLRRLLPNAYADGFGYPRVSVTGKYELPNPRQVSNVIHYTVHRHEKFWNMWFIVWGQYMDHEIVLSNNFPQNYAVPNGKYECCKYKGYHDCLPIQIPHDDPFYGKYKHSCLNFVRAMPGIWPYCALGSREQWNSATPIIDASQVYGPDYAQGAEIRDPNSYGLLKHYNPWGSSSYSHLKPIMHQRKRRPDWQCHRPNKDHYCLMAGDERGTEQAPLMTVHIINMRLHNWLVHQLRYINAHWNQERLFEEARRIVIAINQHISINEWMPALLDYSYLDAYKIRPAKLYRYDYDPYIDPQVTQEFATAAFRFAHSLLPDQVYLASKTHKVIRKIWLRDLLENPTEIYIPGNVDRFMLGALTQPLYKMDQHITDEVRNYLFTHGNYFGEDLAARNILRGREHGIRGYLDYRRFCKLRPVYNWDDLRHVMPNKTVDDFRYLYKSPEDLDLWSAGVAEHSYNKGLIGETFSCLIAEQYSRVIRGDRFWYENPGFPSSFTPGQLKEIKKVSLARLICDHGDDIETVQRWAMQLPDYDGNKFYPCKSKAIPSLNLEPWREKGYGSYMSYQNEKYDGGYKEEQPKYPQSYNQY
jgi:peroxidase